MVVGLLLYADRFLADSIPVGSDLGVEVTPEIVGSDFVERVVPVNGGCVVRVPFMENEVVGCPHFDVAHRVFLPKGTEVVVECSGGVVCWFAHSVVGVGVVDILNSGLAVGRIPESLYLFYVVGAFQPRLAINWR